MRINATTSRDFRKFLRVVESKEVRGKGKGYKKRFQSFKHEKRQPDFLKFFLVSVCYTQECDSINSRLSLS